LDSIAIAAWSTYLSTLAESAATLTGLVFVALSINLTRILSTPGLPGRAAESMMQLLGVLLVSTCVLIPGQPRIVLGAEVLFFGLALLGLQAAIHIRYLTTTTGNPRWWAVVRITQTLCANIPFCVAGILLLANFPAALYWLPPGFVFSLLSGVAGSWILLIEILR
jgi:hypothetical protein